MSESLKKQPELTALHHKEYTFAPSENGNVWTISKNNKKFIEADFQNGCLSCTGPITLETEKIFGGLLEDYKQSGLLKDMPNYKKIEVRDPIHEMPKHVEAVIYAAEKITEQSRGIPGRKIAHVGNYRVTENTDTNTLTVTPRGEENPIFTLDRNEGAVITNAPDFEEQAESLVASFVTEQQQQEQQALTQTTSQLVAEA